MATDPDGLSAIQLRSVLVCDSFASIAHWLSLDGAPFYDEILATNLGGGSVPFTMRFK